MRADAASKQEAEAAATKAETEKAARAATPAYQKFHNLAAKDSGQLPLPYTYKFLAEVFKCTEVVGAMLHNRQEVITVEKFKKGVQQMMRRNFQVLNLQPCTCTHANMQTSKHAHMHTRTPAFHSAGRIPEADQDRFPCRLQVIIQAGNIHCPEKYSLLTIEICLLLRLYL